MSKMHCCFTGHRRLTEKEIPAIRYELISVIEPLLEEHSQCQFFAGGALGFDALAAETVLSLRNSFFQVSLTLVLPCENQTKGWPQREITRYEQIRAQADEVIYTAKSYYEGCMLLRDRYMAEHSDLCIAYLKPESERGGTRYTVDYCLEKGIPVVNLAQRLVMISESCGEYPLY